MLKPWILAGLGLPGSRGTSLLTQTSAGSSRRYRRLDAAGTSNSTNVRLTRQKSTLFQWLAAPLWFPTGKDSLPTDSGAFHSQFCAREIVNAVLIVGGVAFENAGRTAFASPYSKLLKQQGLVSCQADLRRGTGASRIAFLLRIGTTSVRSKWRGRCQSCHSPHARHRPPDRTAEAVTDDQHADQQFGVDRGAADRAVIR